MTKPLYKIFLVEDEIVTREGIRDRVNWRAAGFEFCGEAVDGEAALPLVQAARPDVLITDIKMPFMNGLELCKIVQASMPGIKTIILTGHDEFAYAHQAIQLGIREYLLKPISAQDLEQVLERMAAQLDQEAAERKRMEELQAQLNDSFSMRRDRFLLQLVMGGISSMEALEKSRQFQIDLIARYYQVLIVKVEFPDNKSSPFEYSEYQKVDQLITGIAARQSEVIAFKKAPEETVLILKSDSDKRLAQESILLIEAFESAASTSGAADRPAWRLVTRASAQCSRLGEIPQAFFACVRSFQNAPAVVKIPVLQPESPIASPVSLLQLEPQAVEKFLKCGDRADFDRFFAEYVKPVQTGEPMARLFLEYLFLDILLTASNFIHELGGDTERIIPELSRCEQVAAKIQGIEPLRILARRILTSALDFRDQATGSHHATLVARAQAYIDSHFDDPDLSLAEVATQVHLSPSHFSVVFSREADTTFIEFLTRRRIQKAMELLRTTLLKTSEISDRVGYDNPHYFSTVFKRITGQAPTEFRSQSPGR